MNNRTQLVLNYFKNRHTTNPFTSVLKLSPQPIDFSTHTTEYYDKNCVKLPFKDRSFDFIFSYEQDGFQIFRNPFAMVNECLRLSTRGGVIQCASPLEAVILQRKSKFLMWPDLYTNSLCVLPYHNVFIRNKSKWLDLINYNPLYLTCFYHWEHPMELNIKPILLQDEIYVEEYTELLDDVLHQSVKHTQQFIEQHRD